MTTVEYLQDYDKRIRRRLSFEIVFAFGCIAVCSLMGGWLWGWMTVIQGGLFGAAFYQAALVIRAVNWSINNLSGGRWFNGPPEEDTDGDA